jgi:RHS repeat-associated protein
VRAGSWQPLSRRGGSNYTTADHLGSPRVLTDSTGGVFSRHDYKPFGHELVAGDGGRTSAQGFGVSDGLREKFATYERDDETGLDYAQARYYSSADGRFTSPDPINASANSSHPKTWNKYSYVLNNPLKLIDPSGLTETPAQQEGKQKVPEAKVSVPVDSPETPPQGYHVKIIDFKKIDLDNGIVPNGPDGKPITIKAKDGTVATHGFGVAIQYQVRTGTDNANLGIGKDAVAKETLTSVDTKVKPGVEVVDDAPEQEQKIRADNTFTDIVGVFSQTPISPGFEHTKNQDLSFSTTFNDTRDEDIPLRNNEIKINSTERSVIITDKTDYSPREQ